MSYEGLTWILTILQRAEEDPLASSVKFLGANLRGCRGQAFWQSNALTWYLFVLWVMSHSLTLWIFGYRSVFFHTQYSSDLVQSSPASCTKESMSKPILITSNHTIYLFFYCKKHMQLANHLFPNYTSVGSTTFPRKRMLLVLFSKINNRKDLSNWMTGWRRVISGWSRNLTSGTTTASVPLSPMCSTALWAACGKGRNKLCWSQVTGKVFGTVWKQERKKKDRATPLSHCWWCLNMKATWLSVVIQSLVILELAVRESPIFPWLSASRNHFLCFPLPLPPPPERYLTRINSHH